MFLPLKTEAHDGKVRFGALAIIAVCLLIHLLVWRDNVSRRGEVGGLEQELTRHTAEKKLEKMLKSVGGDGVFDDGTPARERDSSAALAKEKLLEARRSSLFYRLALVGGDFNPINLITHQFAHADWIHLIFNMWFFYLVGVTMEKFWGTGKFILLYLACGIIAALGFMLVSGAKSRGIPMVGASGAIAGMMGAFAVTHGDAKVTMMWMFGFRMGTFQVSSRVYLGFWMVGQLWDAFTHSGQSGGVAFMAHVSGFLGGMLLGKKIPGDVFYKRAYVQDTFSADMGKLVSGEKLDVPSQAKAPSAPAHQNGTEVITVLNQASHAMDDGRRRDAGNLYSSALEKAFGIPGLEPKIMETALHRVLDSQPAAELPGGALYAWARRLESADWWQWAIRFYDAAAADPTAATNAHAKSTARFRAAAIRMDHLFEKDKARQGFQAILTSEPEGNFAEEAGARLKALQSAADLR